MSVQNKRSKYRRPRASVKTIICMSVSFLKRHYGTVDCVLSLCVGIKTCITKNKISECDDLGMRFSNQIYFYKNRFKSFEVQL